ncbi:competence/damage-inducible protein CinA [marine gamma proteobacterium HTCC2143]|jgi:nicotinamide-nucleotide amidase|uniref:CinA-like protein n=1 Tax=marine gamma proteobacterium HTCC2143 TaxID=247633 RepID=A0YCC3_9GAMM|nr:competence/damage-inducible protein CinA [marine gamma proteobacterium HTCC2143]
MKIQLLLTGNELMSGHTIDSNSAMIAEFLSGKGYSIHRKVTVGDEPLELLADMKRLCESGDILIMNGGLGPTLDDLTAQLLSDLTGKPLVENPIARRHLEDWCERRKSPLNNSNLKQAFLPEGVEIIPNPTGSAVGFTMVYEDCLIICTPGVPSELRTMMEQTIVDTICKRHPNDQQIDTIRLQTFGLGESTLQEMVNHDYGEWPEQVELSFRAGIPLLEVKLIIHDLSHKVIQQRCYQRLHELIGDFIIGEESTTLAESVVKLLQNRQTTITTAESCTGGLIASAITEIAGASAVFEAGFVTYSNRMKQQLVGVSELTLKMYGAVSEEVVIAMTKGALERSGADYGIAVSGVAGPGGGSAEKPVGTVWMAWGHKDNLRTRRMTLTTDRKRFQQMVTAITLDLIRRELLSLEPQPTYYQALKKG